MCGGDCQTYNWYSLRTSTPGEESEDRRAALVESLGEKGGPTNVPQQIKDRSARTWKGEYLIEMIRMCSSIAS